MDRSAPSSPSPSVPVVLRAQLVPCWESEVLLLFLGTVDARGRPLTFRGAAVAFRLFYN